MKDAFGKKVKVNSEVLYSTGGSAGTVYHRGIVIRLIPTVDDPNKSYTPPDRVEIQVKKSSNGSTFAKKPVVYASNVVLEKE